MIKKFHFPSPTTGYAIGEDTYPLKTILKSEDGGAHWFTIYQDSAFEFRSLWFLNELKGFIVGSFGMLKSTNDGGLTWNDYETNLNDGLNDVAFFDSLTGIVIGDYGTLLRTTDGGKSWSLLTSPTSLNLNQVWLANNTSAQIVINGHLPYGETYRYYVNLLTTKDAGLTWQVNADTLKLKNSEHYLSSVFPTQDSGYVVMMSHKLLRTTDGGAHWDTVSISFLPTKLTFINGMTGFAYQPSGVSQIWKTTDRGAHWHLTTEQASGADFYSISFPSSQVGYAIGGISSGNWRGDVIKTTDGGAHWFRPMADLLDGTFLYASFFLDENRGFVGGYEGRLFKTTDGGANWTTLMSDEGFDVSSIFFKDADTGFITSAYSYGTEAQSALYITTDGGKYLHKYIFFGVDRLGSIVFPCCDTGYFISKNYGVQWSSDIYRSTDKGMHWSKIYHSPTVSFSELHFFSSTFGYALTNKGILKTYDGGVTWVMDSIHTKTNSWFSMCFSHPDTGYVVGSYGLILRTTDGGQSWSSQESSTDYSLYSVCFASPNKLFISGKGSVILSGENSPSLAIHERTDVPEHHVTCYPNPMYDHLSISVEFYKPSALTINVFTAQGVPIHSISYPVMTKGKHSISLNNLSLPAGLYYFVVVSNEICETKKIVVEK